LNIETITETIFARGHRNVQATHRSTFEVTKEDDLTSEGDCVIAVSADKAPADFNAEFKRALRRKDAEFTILIEAGEIAETVNALGSPHLILSHPSETVVRKSSYVSDRTLAVRADKSAHELSRKLIEKLRNPKQEVKITLTVRV
jgi:hypothetical protein